MKIEMTIDVDEQEVLDNLSLDDIFDKKTTMASECKDYFKNALLDEFTTEEITDYLGLVEPE